MTQIVRSRPDCSFIRIARQLPVDELHRLVERYEAGATVYELADQFGISRQTVARHLHRLGVPLRRQSLTETQVADAVRDYRAGDSLNKIATRLGVSVNNVRHALLRTGVQMRRPWQRGSGDLA